MPRLTVGLPVYNAMPYLPATVESLLAQTHRDFELLAIDDGSTDASLDYLRSIQDSRLTVLTQPNQGLTATLNRMLELVGDGWLVRHDADDIAMPDRLRLLADAIGRHPRAAMFYTRARYYQDGTTFGTFRTTVASPQGLRMVTRTGYLLSICHPTVALDAARTRALGGYRFDLHVEDVDLWWRMALAHEIRFLPEVTVGFRLNPGSLSSAGLATQMLNTLYVQYLLLSELGGLEPLGYERMLPRLEPLVRRDRLRFRERIRAANIRVGQRRWLSGAGNLLAALAASPGDFARRALYEVGGSGLAVYGEDPLRLIEAGLWDEA